MNADAYNQRGVVYGRKGQYDQAHQDWNQALRVDPTGLAGRSATYRGCAKWVARKGRLAKIGSLMPNGESS